MRTAGQAGYAMAALLVALSVMGILASAAMPVWKQMSKREKEEEFLFRARQYARAIELYQRKMPGALPPNVDLLVDQKYLRKKFKDPITNDDFVLISPSQAIPAATPGAPTGTGTSARGGDPGARGRSAGPRPPTTTSAGRGPGGSSGRGSPTPGGVTEGFIGVSSKSKERSLRVYNGRSHYNEWVVQFVPRAQAPGAGAGGAQTPGSPVDGGRGGGARAPGTPNGRGMPGRGSGRGPGPPTQPGLPGR